VRWVKAASLVAICALFISPLVWMVSGSFTPMVGIMKMPPDVIPQHPTLDNYATVLRDVGLVLRWFANSIIITVVTVALALVVNGCAAYALTVYRFKWTRLVYLAFAATMMVSRYSLLIPTFVLVRTYHLSGIPAVVLTGVFYPLGFFLMYDYMKRVPKDFVESARIDGAGEFRIFRQVMLPLCKPIIGAVMAFKSLDTFGDYVWQMLILQGERERTLIVGMISRIYEDYVYTRLQNYGVAMAVGIVTFLPLLVIYLWTNRYFIEGVTLGGVKE
jgi:ABC-type glycerol-3-phosphate transport system permease component